MDIKSVKLDVGSKRVDIVFTRPNERDSEDTELISKDEPAKTFANAMKNLEGDFRFIMELQDDDNVTVHGVRYGDKGGRDHYMILGGRNVGAGYSSHNTPKLWAPSDTGIQGDSVLTADQVKRLRKVRIEAAKYVDGNRTQQIEMEEPAAEKEEVGSESSS